MRWMVTFAAVYLSLLILPGATPALAQDGRAGSAEDGPWNADLVMLVGGADLRFDQHRSPFVERCGVPAIVERTEGQLLAAFQWFPLDRRESFDRIAISRMTALSLSWTLPETISILGMPPELNRSFDPTLVALPDGRVRLYFSSVRGRPDRRAIYSAVSEDGASYTFEPGQRFGFEESEAFDCAVARLGAEWHLYCPVPRQIGRGYHAVSKDGLAFTRLADVTVPGERDWLGCVIADGGGLRFFGSGEGGWSAFSKDGATWALHAGTAFAAADPGVVHLKDGRYVLVGVGPRRADATLGRPFPREGDEGHGSPRGERPVPPEQGTPALAALEGSITANDRYVYVLRGNEFFQYDAETLELVRRRRLPAPEPERSFPPRRPPEGGRRSGGEER